MTTDTEAKQVEQARRYAEQDDYRVTQIHLKNLLRLYDEQAETIADLQRQLADCKCIGEALNEVGRKAFE